MKQLLIIHSRLDGMNDYIYACRNNRYCGAEMKRENQAIVAAEIKAQKIQPVKGVLILRYTFYEPNMRRDPDNISGFAHKIVQDALVECGIINNDGWKNIYGYEDSFRIDRQSPRVEIELVEQ